MLLVHSVNEMENMKCSQLDVSLRLKSGDCLVLGITRVLMQFSDEILFLNAGKLLKVSENDV